MGVGVGAWGGGVGKALNLIKTTELSAGSAAGGFGRGVGVDAWGGGEGK